jgi:dihydrofolate reductase
MSIQASVYIATSLDGFIARRDGSLDWLDQAASTVPDGEDCGYKVFMDSVELLIMGRASFEKVLSFGKWPYTKPVVVLSHAPISFPESLPDSVTHSSDSPAALLKRLESEGIRRVYVDGGKTIQGFLAAGLIDDLTLTRIPILLGDGIPLFAGDARDIPLTHVRTIAYDFGFVQSTYSVQKVV